MPAHWRRAVALTYFSMIAKGAHRAARAGDLAGIIQTRSRDSSLRGWWSLT